MADESSSANPLPADAEHAPAAPLPSESTGSNPLPQDAEHTPAPVAPTPSDSNPLSESVSKVEAKPAANDALVSAVGYFFWPLALISLMGQNVKAKFHGAQALLYSGIMLALYAPVFMLTGVLGLAGGVAALLSTLVFIVYVLVLLVGIPLFMAFKTFQGADVLLPVIGRFVADKVGYNPES